MATYDRCEWCQQPKGADVHPTHFTQTQCIDVLKVELQKAEESGIDAIRAVAVKLAEVTVERDRMAARLAMATAALEHYADPAKWSRVHKAAPRNLREGGYGWIVAQEALAAAREAGSVSTGAAEDATEPQTPSP